MKKERNREEACGKINTTGEDNDRNDRTGEGGKLELEKEELVVGLAIDSLHTDPHIIQTEYFQTE